MDADGAGDCFGFELVGAGVVGAGVVLIVDAEVARDGAEDVCEVGGVVEEVDVELSGDGFEEGGTLGGAG